MAQNPGVSPGDPVPWKSQEDEERSSIAAEEEEDRASLPQCALWESERERERRERERRRDPPIDQFPTTFVLRFRFPGSDLFLEVNFTSYFAGYGAVSCFLLLLFVPLCVRVFRILGLKIAVRINSRGVCMCVCLCVLLDRHHHVLWFSWGEWQ
jgi:hypothetical protein